VTEDPVGPGSYNADRRFGDNATTYTIGTKKEQIIGVSPGPGAYDPQESVIKTKQVNVIISPAKDRDLSPRKATDGGVGPGTYEDNKNFGKDNVKSFTIGQIRNKKTEQSVGPGTYAPEIADL
jgi:hypothetical protein